MATVVFSGALLTTLVVIVGLLWMRRRLLVVTVAGSSMEPTFRPGQRLIARRARGSDVRRGDVVVIRDDDVIGGPPPVRAGRGRPRVGGRSSAPCLIKRVAARAGDPVPSFLRDLGEPLVPVGKIVLMGDNAEGSHDSRQHGYYLEQQVLGIVIQ